MKLTPREKKNSKSRNFQCPEEKVQPPCTWSDVSLSFLILYDWFRPPMIAERLSKSTGLRRAEFEMAMNPLESLTLRYYFACHEDHQQRAGHDSAGDA